MNEWKPHPKQELFLTLPWYEVLFGGTKGPGKTDALLMEATRQVDKPYYRGIIFRRTFPKLQEVIDRSHKWFEGHAKYNSQIHRWTWSNGAFLQFGSCKDEQDKYNYQGHEYHYMGFDQVEEFNLTQYLFLLAQNRSKYGDIACYTRSSANPGNVGHLWVKDRFIDRLTSDGTPKFFKRSGDIWIETDNKDPKGISRAFVFATLDDNPSLLENDPEYENRLEMLPPKEYEALRFGNWDIFEGQFFDTWDRNIHIVPMPEGEYNEIIGLDYGYGSGASSVGWYKVLIDGKLVRYKELYQEKLTYSMLAEKIIEMTGKPDKLEYAVADPAIWKDRAHHKDSLVGESGAETMQRIFDKAWGTSKVILVQADNNRKTGWGRCREYLRPYKGQHDKMTAKFGVTQNCYNFIRTVPGQVYSQTKPDDMSEKGEDHCAAEWRYICMSRPESPVVSEETHILTRDERAWKWVREQATRKKEKKIIGM